MLGVGLGLADDLPDVLLVGVLVDQRHGRAELDGVAAELRNVDDLGARELVLELGDRALVQRLLFLRGMILGVLGQIAVRPRLRDLLDDARPFDLLAVLEIFLQHLMSCSSHRNLLNHFSILLRAMDRNPNAGRSFLHARMF
jgi:hypothetical protein